MKKIGITVLLIIGVRSVVIGVIALYSLKSNVPSSTAIIGGADIPTSLRGCGVSRQRFPCITRIIGYYIHTIRM